MKRQAIDWEKNMSSISDKEHVPRKQKALKAQ